MIQPANNATTKFVLKVFFYINSYGTLFSARNWNVLSAGRRFSSIYFGRATLGQRHCLVRVFLPVS